MSYKELPTETPMNLRERRSFYRFFYNTVPGVAVFIDRPLFKKFKLGDIDNIYGSPGQRIYIYDFFAELCSRLKLVEIVLHICHEYLLMGNCTVFVEGCERKSKKANKYDHNPLYQRWEKILILPPDQVKIGQVPLSDEAILKYVPDPETLKYLKESKKHFKGLDSKIPLEQDPNSGSFAHLFARKSTQYDIAGVSLIERYMGDLLKEKKISMKLARTEMELIRSKIKTFIEEYLFRPVAIKKGFIYHGGSDDRVLFPTIEIS